MRRRDLWGRAFVKSSSDFISDIYEAAGSPEQWPIVLRGIAGAIGAFGACFVHRTGQDTSWILSHGMEELGAAYLAEGWLTRDDRVPPVIAEHHPGFRVDADYWTEQQVREMPIYRDFLLPRNLHASAATLIQGSRDDVLHVAVEGLSSYATARSALPFLNDIRPHLARAISLSAKLARAYAEGMVSGLDARGVGAAVVSSSGRIRAANESFGTWLDGNITDAAGHVRFADPAANEQLRLALALETNSRSGGRSFPIRGAGSIAAIHCLPLKGKSRDVFESDGFILMMARPGNRMVPTADLLRLLFDLTPAEARLARLLAQGRTVAEAARESAIQPNTVRAHLKAIYAKTGFSGQSELAVTLSALGTKDDLADD